MASLLGRDPRADDLVVLGVDAGQPAGGRDRLERAQQLTVRDSREALRMGLEGRELERRRAGVDERLHVGDRPARRDRRPQRDVDVRLALNVGDLGLERVDAVDRTGGVVGHVDDRRDAAGRGRQRAALDPLAVVAAGVDVDVDGSREQQRVAEIEAATGLAQLLDAAVANRDTGPLRRAAGGHDPTRELLDH